MTGILYLGWRYLSFHRIKTLILLTSITLILFIPVGLRVLVDQSSRQLTARAESTPLVVGSKGSPLELALNTLYFSTDVPEPIPYATVDRLETMTLGQPIPMSVRFHVRNSPIVGTTLDYFSFRGLEIQDGRSFALLGECVLGSRAAREMNVSPGDAVISSPENVFDLAGVYPLKMHVVGILEYSDSADDDAIFVDIKTDWVIQGLGHGHQDLSKPEASSAVLKREANQVTANASVVQYNEVTKENIASFHFHGNLSEYPITSIIVIPPDQKSSALLQGRFESSDEPNQIMRPAAVMQELLETVVTVQNFVVAGALVVGLATLATAILVFMLSLRLRLRERETLFKIGGSRMAIGSLMASEIIAVLASGVVLAGSLTYLTSQFGSAAARAFIRMQ